MSSHRPTEAESLIEGGPVEDQRPQKRAADAVIEHLRLFGATARVLALAPSEKVLRGMMSGPDGLVTLYDPELSGERTSYRLLHNSGGQVDIFLSKQAAHGGLRGGGFFSLLWHDSFPRMGQEGFTAGSMHELALLHAREFLKLGQNPVEIASEGGFYREMAQK